MIHHRLVTADIEARSARFRWSQSVGSGLGSPRQEEVAMEFLQVPNLKLVWTVGGLFDFMSGRIKRAPSIMRALRLEWLFRIYLEPRRLALRYLFDALWLAKSCAYEWLVMLNLK